MQILIFLYKILKLNIINTDIYKYSCIIHGWVFIKNTLKKVKDLIKFSLPHVYHNLWYVQFRYKIWQIEIYLQQIGCASFVMKVKNSITSFNREFIHSHRKPKILIKK